MELEEDPGATLGEWLADRVRRHWLLVGSLVAMLVLLVLAPSVWRVQVEISSRSGRSWHVPLAERGLWLTAVGLGLYLLAGLGAPRHWAMRPPTDGEIAVARWLMRAAGLLAMWTALYVTIP